MQCTIQKSLKTIKIEPDCEVVRVVDAPEGGGGGVGGSRGHQHPSQSPSSHVQFRHQGNQKILLSPRNEYHLTGKNCVLISEIEHERNQQQRQMLHRHHQQHSPQHQQQQQVILTRQPPPPPQAAAPSSSTSTSKSLPSTQQVRVIKDGRFYDETRQNSNLSPFAEQYHAEAEHLSGKAASFHPKSSNKSTIHPSDESPHHHHLHYHHASHQNIPSSLPPPTGSRKYFSSRHVNVISTNSNSNSNSNNNKTTSDIMCNSVSGHDDGSTSSALFRTPIVTSSSSPMRPPPPPPPPKVKSFTSPPSTATTTTSSSSSSSSNTSSSNEEPSSSIPDLEFDGTTVLCRVCGDKASGFHYGVHSCEGCKGFFRRSIQQKIQYRPCTKNQQCSILRINRNRCQYCRLKKCIAVGMSRDAVRFGRVPKREKARILAAMQQSSQNRGQQRALATELDDQPRLLAAVLRAHMETCEFTKDKVAAMRQRARECPSFSMPTLLACPLNPAPELQSEQEFSQRFAHVIRGVIDFAGMIPGFQLLTQDDKFTLLKAGLFDALFVRLICMFDSSINSIICLNGQVMRRDAIQNGANARFLVDSTFNFAKRMNSMNLTDAEIGLFCAIVLITPDRPGLRNVELIEKMYSRLKGCLQSIISQNRPDQPDFMLELLKTLPDLRTLSTLHTEKLVVFRTEHKEMLRQHMWTMDDDHTSKSPRTNTWDSNQMEDVAKSPLGSVSSTESGDIEYSPSSLASSAPLLAATLSGTCPLRDRANSGSSAEDDIIGSHAHLTQNGLTITPIARSHSQTHSHMAGRYRKLDSPTDSGIESGNEKAESTKALSSGGSSSCSSPRSSVDDILDEHNANHGQNLSGKRQTVDDMPVLKRVLQAPPLYDTNSLMDEAYKPHKKFRALRHRDVESSDADVHTTQIKYSPSAQQQQQQQQQQHHYQSPTQSLTASPSSSSLSPPSSGSASSSSATVMAASSPSHPSVASPSSAGGMQQQHQSQLHMHLLKGKMSSNNSNNNSSSGDNLSNSNSHQTQYSSLSSTHSVLAKSLMEEPRMTPEQIKRTDIIQNYIMREQTNSSIVCNSSPSSQHYSSSSSNSNCASPSTTVVFTPPSQSHSMRWQGHSVITTTPVRQQPPSPNNISGGVTVTNTGRYLQSPHSTSVSPPCPSPSSGQSPRLLELQVDIADSQQPLNLSKKSPTPPPPTQQPVVKVHQTKSINLPNSFPLSADVTVTATPAVVTTATPQVHKVLLEA